MANMAKSSSQTACVAGTWPCQHCATSLEETAAHPGAAWALPVQGASLAKSPQPQERDFYSVAFLYRAFSRKIPWDAFYIAVSWLSASLFFLELFFFSPLKKEVKPRR